MIITPYRLKMAKRCLTSRNVLLIDDLGMVGTYKIHGDLFVQYCLRMVHKAYARAVKNRKSDLNRRAK